MDLKIHFKTFLSHMVVFNNMFLSHMVVLIPHFRFYLTSSFLSSRIYPDADASVSLTRVSEEGCFKAKSRFYVHILCVGVQGG